MKTVFEIFLAPIDLYIASKNLSSVHSFLNIIITIIIDYYRCHRFLSSIDTNIIFSLSFLLMLVTSAIVLLLLLLLAVYVNCDITHG